MLLDDGDDLPQLLEEVLTHVLITAADHTQEGRHHLRRGGEGRGGEGRDNLFSVPNLHTCIP